MLPSFPTRPSSDRQLIFLPLVAWIDSECGWRAPSLGTTATALAVLPLVAWLLRDRPRDVGAVPYGGTAADDVDPVRTGAARLALRALVDAARTGPFWFLVAGMAICGATTFGLIQPHFVPARSEEHTSELQSRQYLVC